MNSNISILSEKIERLSPEQISEVDDFVEFLHLRSQDRQWERSAAAMSSAAFDTVWNSRDDDDYDAL